jgi:hypothetical protein
MNLTPTKARPMWPGFFLTVRVCSLERKADCHDSVVVRGVIVRGRNLEPAAHCEADSPRKFVASDMEQVVDHDVC